MDLVEEIETDFGLNGFQVSTGPKKKKKKGTKILTVLNIVCSVNFFFLLIDSGIF